MLCPLPSRILLLLLSAAKVLMKPERGFVYSFKIVYTNFALIILWKNFVYDFGGCNVNPSPTDVSPNIRTSLAHASLI